MMTCLQEIIAVGVVTATLSGCVAVPVAIPEERPFHDFVDTKLAIGVTKKDEIRAELGEPELNAANWWLFHDLRAGWQWAGCEFSATGSCGKDPRGSTSHYLRVGFDTNGVVSEYQLLKDKELCAEYRICFKNGLLMQAASEVEERASQEFAALPGRCVLYLYGKSYFGPKEDVISIFVNDRPAGSLVNADGYLSLSLPAGAHYLTITRVYLANKHSRSEFVVHREFACESNQIKYLRYDASAGMMGWSRRLVDVDEAQGQADIRHRWLVSGPNEF